MNDLKIEIIMLGRGKVEKTETALFKINSWCKTGFSEDFSRFVREGSKLINSEQEFDCGNSFFLASILLKEQLALEYKCKPGESILKRVQKDGIKIQQELQKALRTYKEIPAYTKPKRFFV